MAIHEGGKTFEKNFGTEEELWEETKLLYVKRYGPMIWLQEVEKRSYHAKGPE